AMPRSSSCCSNSPTIPIVLDHTVGVNALAGLAKGRLLQMGEDVHPRRVEPDEARPVSLAWRLMKSLAPPKNSSSTVGIRAVFSGPVSSIFPSADALRTPRGPNCLRKFGSLG